MNTPTYRNILRVLEKWPIDQDKVGRDLGEFIRKEIVTAFNPSATTKLNIATWDEIQASLSRIATNRYQTLYPTSSNVRTATGLSAEICKAATSNEASNLGEQEEESAFKRFANKVRRSF